MSLFVGDLQAAADQLNELGAQAWEVIGVVAGDSSRIVYALKRLRA